MPPSTKQEQLKSILQLLGTSVTKSELNDAIKTLVKFVQDLKASNEREWSLIRSSISMLTEKLSQDNKADVETVRTEVSKQIQKALAEQDSALNAFNKKLAEMKDGEDGEAGKAPTKEELVALILPLIPMAEKGEDGKDITQETVDALRAEIKDLEKRVSDQFTKLPHGGARSSHSTRFTDLSSKTNGILKVFAVPEGLSGVLFSSDFPTAMMENNGYTINVPRTQITLTTANAPSLGSQLLYISTDIANY